MTHYPSLAEIDDRALIERLADAARAEIAPYFRASDLVAENKAAAGFDPVTIADRAGEAVIRALLDAARPDDGVLGEEYGARASTSGRTWVLDPIDGTRAFIAGLLNWGVLIGLHDGARATLGVLDQPYTRERFLGDRATGRATLTRDGATRTLKTRPCARLADATFLTTDPRIFLNAAETAAYEAVAARARHTRFGTDCYGYAMVAAGTVDVVLESGLNPYDIQALIPIVEAAGGVVSNWRGERDLWSGQALAVGDPKLLDDILPLLSAAASEA